MPDRHSGVGPARLPTDPAFAGKRPAADSVNDGGGGGDTDAVPGGFYRCSDVVWRDPTANDAARRLLSTAGRLGVNSGPNSSKPCGGVVGLLDDRSLKEGRGVKSKSQTTGGWGILEWIHQRWASVSSVNKEGGVAAKPLNGSKGRKSERDDPPPGGRLRAVTKKKLPRALAGFYTATLNTFFAELLVQPQASEPSPLIPAEPSVRPLIPAEPSVQVFCKALHVAALLSEEWAATSSSSASSATSESSMDLDEGSDEDQDNPSSHQIHRWEASRQQVRCFILFL